MHTRPFKNKHLENLELLLNELGKLRDSGEISNLEYVILKCINQYSDSLTGYSVSIVERAQNTNSALLTMPNFNYHDEDAVNVRHHTQVLSEFEDESQIVLH